MPENLLHSMISCSSFFSFFFAGVMGYIEGIALGDPNFLKVENIFTIRARELNINLTL